MLDLHRAMVVTLRPFGLEPGRALANARPDADALAAQRAEQLWFIETRLAELADARENVPA